MFTFQGRIERAIRMDDERKAYPSIARIAHDTGYSERQVIRTLKKLEGRELIDKVLKQHKGVAGEIGTLATAVAQHDVTAIVTQRGITLATQLGEKGIEEAKRVVREMEGKDNPALAGLDFYVVLLQAIREEVEALGLAAGRQL